MYFKYIMKKIILMPSTYITLIIGIFLPIVFSLIAITQKTNFSDSLWLVSMLAFPLQMFFIIFISIKIFREEIDAGTFLIFQAKPITRKQLVWQSIIAIMIAVFTLVLLNFIFSLGILAGNNVDVKRTFLGTLSIFGVNLLLITIAGLILLYMSISMKGKTIVAFGLGFFGIGLYLIVVLMTTLRTLTSKEATLPKISSKYEYNVSVSQSGDWFYVYDDIFSLSNRDSKTTIKNNVDKLDEGVYKYIKWFDFTGHWLSMYSAGVDLTNAPSSSEPLLVAFLPQKQKIISTKENAVEAINAGANSAWVTEQYNNDSHGIFVKAKTTRSLPLWYPFVIWTLIALIALGLTFRSLKRKNIQ